jgi:hypothetical protein
MKTSTLLIGALLIGGGVYLYSKSATANAPPLEDQANKALASESNPYTLRALAAKVRAAGFGSLADLLEAKATGIIAFQKPQMQGAPAPGDPGGVHPATSIALLGAGVSQGSATLSFHQALLAGGVHARASSAAMALSPIRICRRKSVVMGYWAPPPRRFSIRYRARLAAFGKRRTLSRARDEAFYGIGRSVALVEPLWNAIDLGGSTGLPDEFRRSGSRLGRAGGRTTAT